MTAARRWWPASVRAARLAGMVVAVAVLAAPMAAHAQSSVDLTATPSTFTSGTAIAIEASVTPGASPEDWCFEWENCYIVGVVPFLHVYGSNGFYAYAEDWTVAVNDVVPGQTMQGATYTAHGGVQWVVCWGFTYCVEYAYPYEEGWSSPATVTPAVPGPPTADWVSPSSGAGPGQIFTVQYASEGGASHLAELWLVVHPSGGLANSCVIGYYAAANTVVLWHDSGVGTPEESSGTPGSGTLLSNSQCAVSLSGTSASTGVSTRTLTVPVAFAPGYHGVQYVYGWAKDGGGVYGSTAVLGNWVARARIDSVAPNPTTVGSTVTLSGDGFGASQGGSIAQVNATPLSVTSWTATSITATVPPGATSGPVTVVTNGTWSNEDLTLAIAGDPPGGEDEVIYYHSDALGSVRMITDATGAVVARYDYLPFGQPYPSDQDPEPRRFGQLERTAGTGNGSWTLLDYALARHYHSQSGRFTTPDDPSFGDPFDPQSMNLYAYARNNPLRFVDPTGNHHEEGCPVDYCEHVTVTPPTPSIPPSITIPREPRSGGGGAPTPAPPTVPVPDGDRCESRPSLTVGLGAAVTTGMDFYGRPLPIGLGFFSLSITAGVDLATGQVVISGLGTWTRGYGMFAGAGATVLAAAGKSAAPVGQSRANHVVLERNGGVKGSVGYQVTANTSGAGVSRAGRFGAGYGAHMSAGLGHEWKWASRGLWGCS